MGAADVQFRVATRHFCRLQRDVHAPAAADANAPAQSRIGRRPPRLPCRQALGGRLSHPLRRHCYCATKSRQRNQQCHASQRHGQQHCTLRWHPCRRRFACIGRRLVGDRQRVQGVRQFAAEGCPEHAARRVDAGAVRSERERGGGERGVDAHDPSAGVQERAAAVAGVDVRAVLHDAQPSQPPGAFDDAPDAAFVVARRDGRGHGVGSAGKAHGEHVEQWRWRRDGQRQWAQGAEPVVADAQHGEVQAFRGPHRLRQCGALAVPRHDAPAASHNVVVRCDVSLRVQREAGAVAVLHHQQHHGCGGSIAHGGIVQRGCSRRVRAGGSEDGDQRERERTRGYHAVSDESGRGLCCRGR